MTRPWEQRFKSALFGTLLGVLIPALAFGQATLLPNAKQQYFDDSGNPVSNGQVFYYVPSTTTKKTIWQDSGEVTPQANPVLLDAAGRPQPAGQTYGSGLYRQKVIDHNGLTIWDAVTSSTGSGSGTSPAFSEGVMVGTILPWANMVLPAKYLYTAGQAVSRSTYPDLLTALTFSTVVLCQAGIATITVPASISDRVPIGAPIEISCFTPGTIVTSKASGTLTLSTNATTTLSTTGVLFPWGNGDGSTTFNVPNISGRTIVGRDNMNGAAAGVLTSAYYLTPGGSGVNPDAINAVAGNQSQVLVTGNLPPYTPAGSTPFSAGLASIPVANLTSVGGATDVNRISLKNNANTDAGTYNLATVSGTVTFTGTPQGGTSVAFTRVQPSVTADYIIKALPDDTPGGPGVSSIQGMTGAIACAGAVVCSGNTITVTVPSNGVSSVGGLTGAIACGSGMTCTAGTISTTAATAVTYQSRAIAITQNLTALSAIQTLGYATAGDGGGAVFKKVGAISFTDSYISTASVTNGGGAYTNGTYLGVRLGGGTGLGCTGKVVVAGGVVASVDISGTLCPGYTVGDALIPNATDAGGTGSGALYTVSVMSTALGSFIDSASNRWQIVVDSNGFPNVRQCGAKLDWNGVDGSATNDLPSFKSCMAFAMFPFGSSSALVNGNILNVPKGAALLCAGASPFTTLVVPAGVVLNGAGRSGGTTLKQCTGEASGTHFITLCDPNAKSGQFGCELQNLSVVTDGASNNSIANIYSNSGQQFPLVDNVYIQATSRGCILYELGQGGAANAIFENFDCEQTDSSTNKGFIGNSSNTQIVIRNSNFGCAPGNCPAGNYAINMVLGNFVVDVFHMEQHPDAINVATTGASSLSSIRNGTITTGCVNGITLTKTNPNNTVLVENIQSSCSNATVLNGHSLGSNTAGNILKQLNYAP